MKKALACLLLLCAPMLADEDTFKERFADPATRQAALAELIPGSRDRFFYTALDHQLNRRTGEFAKVLAEWKAASTRRESPVSAGDLSLLENRELLMAYDPANPAASLDKLVKRLDLKFDDDRPDAAAAENFSTRLDPALVSQEAFNEAALARSPDAHYQEFRGERRYRELERLDQFDENKARWFLSQLDRADLPGVVPLVEKGFSLDPPVSFGSAALHHKLTLDQLTALLERHPGLKANEAFNRAYLAKHLPGVETDFEVDPAALAGHLRLCRDYALTLPPAANSLKAHVLFHHLRLQHEAGNFPKDDFLTFLALPRSSRWQQMASEASANAPTARLDADYQTATTCPPVGEDTPLIESYLQHFLGETDSAADFGPLVPENLLTKHHARARLLAGADAGRWGRLIDPSEFRALQEETRISFAPGTLTLLDADAAVTLPLELKNTPELLLRIYELDLPAVLSRNGTEPEVSLDLEGLVAHHERRLKFPQPATQLHRETIALPELTGAGAWIVDFVSGQSSARILVRKGRLIPYLERDASGQSIRAFDEKGAPFPHLVAKLGTETFTSDASGKITIPDSSRRSVLEGIVQAGKLAAPIRIGERAEALALDMGFHLEHEQLLADQQARGHLRVRITNHGHEIPLDRLKGASLILKARLVGDATIERALAEDFKLSPVMEIPFQVPADLLRLTLTLRGTVVPSTGGEPVKLSGETNYALNSDFNTARIGAAHLSPTAGGHRLEVRGRNGEPLPSKPVTLSFYRPGYEEPIQIKLATDAAGRIELGNLEGLGSVLVTGEGISQSRVNLGTGEHEYPTLFHVLPDAEIRLPLDIPSAAPGRARLSLLELRDGQPLRDHFEKIAIQGTGIVVRGLPPGEFRLTQGARQTTIQVSAGAERAGLLVSRTRILPHHAPIHPAIASAGIEGDQLRVRIGETSPATRISVIGKRYRRDEWRSEDLLSPFPLRLRETLIPGIIAGGFLTDRELDDETRYILDRRAAKTFPGSMLPRPGLLLNRWTEDDLEQEQRTGREGTGGSLNAPITRASRGVAAPEPEKRIANRSGVAATCDFLANPAVVRFDLTPAADGTLTLPLADFKGSQFIEIVSTDSFANDTRIVPLPAGDTPVRDRRIAKPLDPDAHHLITRSGAAIAKGGEATIETALDADWRAFTTLADAYQLLYGMLPDQRLREFAILMNWPDLSEERKLEFLSDHASHETHLFLFRKDRAFFDKHVKPLLAQKSEPRFMDDFLLGRDLKSYLRPYAWNRLNAAEKALLCQALPDARQRISRELSLRWDLEAPGPDEETRLFTRTLGGSGLEARDHGGLARNAGGEESGVARILAKLQEIIIPVIDLEDVTVHEAIEKLRVLAAEQDLAESDPAKKGVNIVVRTPRTGVDDPLGAPGGSLLPALDPGELRIKELRVRDAPLGIVLKYICDAAKLRYNVYDFSVTLVPQTELGEDLFTRTFRVPPDFPVILGGSGGPAADDPFAPRSDPGARRILPRGAIKDLLISSGISFGDGSSATLTADGTLLVTNTPTELEKIEQITTAASSGPDNSILPPEADGFAEGGAMPATELPNVPDDPFAPGDGNSDKMKPRPALPSYRTRLWRESNYYRNLGPSDESLVPLNRFWLDLAAWDGNGPFLSPHFNACNQNPNEILLCLALLDLPFKAEAPETIAEGGTLRLKAREAMLLYYKDTRRTNEVAAESPLLVRQTFSPLGAPTRKVEGREVENPVTGDFTPGVPYLSSLVITNPSGVSRRIDLLAQIPAGAIPLEGKPGTLSLTQDLKPHGVAGAALAFYFPAPGQFAVYPLHVSESGQVLAYSTKRVIKVTRDPANRDKSSWDALASAGTNEEVLARLKSENLATADLEAIRWRLRDREFFLGATTILRDRLYFSPRIFAYGFHHHDVPSIREYLENSKAVGELGAWLDSPLLEIRPTVHLDWETLEFDPLVNARAHRFGPESRLTHDEAREYYLAFLDQLCWKPALSDSDQLRFTALLFLQDRIEEGLERFAKIDPAKLPGRLNYDYLRAVTLFYQSQPAEAKAIATGILPNLPPGTWRERFEAVSKQADEIAALAQAPAESQPAEPVASADIDLALAADGKLVIKHRSIEKAELRFFAVDLEFLFSKDPFLSNGDAGEEGPEIQPNAGVEVPLARGVAETTIELPEALRNGNVLVSAAAGPAKRLKILDSRALEIRRVPSSGEIQVIETAGTRPLPNTYVKIYVETTAGETVFHKDGYTDLRGRFDCLSHTGVDPSTIKRFAVLASHPAKGARTSIQIR